MIYYYNEQRAVVAVGRRKTVQPRGLLLSFHHCIVFAAVHA